jgi:O-antigen ligase
LPPALLAFALIVVTARAGGGYAPETWGWIALGPLLALAAMLARSERIEFGAWDVAFLGTLVLLALWAALSVTWSDSVPRTVAEVERVLVYVAAVAALLAVTTRRSAAMLPGAVLAAATAFCAYALITRLAPNRFGLDLANGYRLSRPIGYWNGLGLVAAMTIVLALGVAASASRTGARMLAAGAPVALVATLCFTFSRGAWIALGVGVAVALAVDPHRSRLTAITVALTPFLAAAIWLCSRADGLTHVRAARQTAAHDGQRLAFALLALSVACALVPAALARLAPDVRLRLPRAASVALTASLVASLVAIAVVGLVRIGGPQAVWERSADAFRASPWPPESTLQGRLFTVSGHNRADYWRVAWSQASSHPWLGSGAGTYDLYWTRERPVPVGALDAHNVYLETLAELGPLGLLLLAGLLATPLLALGRARHVPGVAAAGGAYAAYILAAAVDWHWELPTVTLVALCCGAAVVTAGRGAGAAHPLGRAARVAALAAVGAGIALALIIQVGNGSVAASTHDATAGDYTSAEAGARRATRWAPWSPAGWVSLERAQRAQGELGPARASLRRALRLDPSDWRLWYELTLVSTGKAKGDAAARMQSLNPYAPATVGTG